MQPLRAVTSVLRVDTVAVIPGIEDAPLYVPVHPVAVGSVRQALMGVRSAVAEVNEAGSVEAAEWQLVSWEFVSLLLVELSRPRIPEHLTSAAAET